MEFKRMARGSSLPHPDMAPLIDVIFHLLLFFMAFSTLQHIVMSMDVELPQAVSNSGKRTETFEISVTKDGVFYIQNKMVTGAELQAALLQSLQQNPDLFVVIKGDKRASYEYIVQAMDYVKQLGVDNLGLAVQVP